MNNNENIYKSLISKIHSTRRKENILGLTTGALITLSITFAVILLVGFVESIAHGDTTLRTILAGSVFVSFVVSFGIFVFPAILKSMGVRNSHDDNGMALRIGNHFGDVKDNLCNALQLVPISKNPGGVSGPLAMAAFEEIASKVTGKNFDEIIKYDDLKKSVLFFVIALMFLGFANVFFPSSFSSAIGRIANFNASYLPPVPFGLTIEPLNKSVIRGDKVKITVKSTGIAPESITLFMKEENQETFNGITLKLTANNEYFYEINSLKNSISFYAQHEWFGEPVMTEKGIIKVIDKPIIKSFAGKLIFPSYTNQSASFFNEQNADFTAIVGSKADFSIISNKDLQAANIIFIKKQMIDPKDSLSKNNDTSRIKLNITGKRAEGILKIASSGNYFIELVDKDGEKSENPIQYSVIAMQDEYPSIALINPKSDVEVATTALLPIKVNIADDYGLSKLKLFYRLAKSPYAAPDEKFSSYEIKFTSNELNIEVPYIWDLNKNGIMPEDVFEFYLEVSDNDIVNGPKSAKTQTLSVRLPSLQEVQKESDMLQAKIEKDLDKIMKEAMEVKKDLEELSRDLQSEKNKLKEPEWKQKKKAEDIAKKQDELKEKMSDMAKSLENATEKLQENQMISPETMQKYQELQNLMKQVDSPELRRMQEKMQEAMKNMNQEQLQKAMEQFKFNDEQFRKSIERSMKILQRLQAEQKTDALRKRAEELAKQQDELSEETKKSNPSDKDKQNELSKRQDKIQKELNNIEKDLKNLEKMMQEIGEEEMPMKDLEQAMNDLNPEETNQEMDNSKQNMESGDNKKSSQNQKKASDNMKKFAQQMKKMKENMQQQNAQEAIEKMDKYISDMLELSKKQESVKNNTSKADYNSTKIPQYAQEQAENFESLMSVAQSMSELSQKSFAVTPEMANEVSTALKEMRKAVESMADRNTQKAAQSQSGAMGAMNRAASQMQEMSAAMKAQQNGSCNNPGGSGSGSGSNGSTPGMSMSQKMQEIAAQQQAINQAMQQMMQGNGKGQGGGQMNMEQQAEMGRLADKQGSAKKSIEELAKEQKELSGGDTKKLDQLEKIAKEMQEIMSDIKQNGVTPDNMRKQERILSRLLDASKSVNDRDYEEQREGKSAQNIYKKSPGEIDFSTQEGRDKIMKDMMKANQRGYSKDYENLIKAYFESLQKNKDNF
jgi:hypothetical protein